MAVNTPKEYRNMVMYSVFVRNYSEEGTFEGVRKDLDRIKRLGVDIIWLLPIHPIGEKARKGVLGSPYAISDYRAVNPEYGTIDDLKRLVAEIHDRGMKCIIDVVYNHTSPDSRLAAEHPEWFYRRADGSFGNKVGEWLDVIDLDYRNHDLWAYQIETLKMWSGIVDGFRCDVAPLIPLEFWLEARKAVAQVNPDCFWLSESVEPVFTVANRARGMVSLSDSEIYQAFDVGYEYDIFAHFKAYLKGEATLSDYVRCINQQEAIYPENYVKLRFLENHDNARAAFIIPDEKALLNWTSFLYFQKGMTLLYAGQEKMCSHLPSLFDRDAVCWTSEKDLSSLMARLYEIKKHPLFTNSSYEVKALPHDVICASHSLNGKRLIGIFPVRGNRVLINMDLPNGFYTNMIGGKPVEVHAGMLHTDGLPIILDLSRPEDA